MTAFVKYAVLILGLILILLSSSSRFGSFFYLGIFVSLFGLIWNGYYSYSTNDKIGFAICCIGGFLLLGAAVDRVGLFDR